MIQEIKMPSAGQTTDEAKIVTINVKPGDTVKRGDVLVEAETDKAVLPVESFAAGVVLDVLVNVGDNVDAGSVLVAIGKKGDIYNRHNKEKTDVHDDLNNKAESVSEVTSSKVANSSSKVGKEIKMPSAGQTTDDAKIVTVNVKPGDTVKRGDVLVEAETDKAVLPVESYVQGQVLDVLVNVGDTVTAGSVLVVVGKPGELAKYSRNGMNNEKSESNKELDDNSKDNNSLAIETEEEYIPIIKGQAVLHTKLPSNNISKTSHASYPAMPNAKWMARDKGVDLSLIVPENGQFIKRSDILAAESMQQEANTSIESPVAQEPEYEVLQMTHIRSIIGKRMHESMQNIPAWQCTVSIDMDECIKLRETYIAKRNIKLSYNDIMAKAIAVASKKYNLVNARYENDEVRIYHHTNVGLAVALDNALVVPVVKNIDEKAMDTISKDYKAIIKKARDGKLLPSDMGCGSITISNLGMYDVDQFIAIVNPPESCILAVGSIKVEPVWDGKAFQPVHKMTVTGSFDHRIIDGAYGAQFLKELKVLMENPTLML